MGWKESLKKVLAPPLSLEEQTDPAGAVRKLRKLLPGSAVRPLIDPATRSAATRALNDGQGPEYGQFVVRYVADPVDHYQQGLIMVRVMADAAKGAHRASDAARVAASRATVGQQLSDNALLQLRDAVEVLGATNPPPAALERYRHNTLLQYGEGPYSLVLEKIPEAKRVPVADALWVQGLLLAFFAQDPATAADTVAHVRYVGRREILNGGELSILGEMKETYFDAVGLVARVVESGVAATGKSRREAIPERVRHAVWRRDEGRCVDCGSKELLEFEHIIPLSKGGANTVRNIELRCQKCHDLKHRKREYV